MEYNVLFPSDLTGPDFMRTIADMGSNGWTLATIEHGMVVMKRPLSLSSQHPHPPTQTT